MSNVTMPSSMASTNTGNDWPAGPRMYTVCPTGSWSPLGIWLTGTFCTISSRRSPYASAAGMCTVLVSPCSMSFTAASKPGIIWPAAQVNSMGSPRSTDESNFVPSSSVPV